MQQSIKHQFLAGHFRRQLTILSIAGLSVLALTVSLASSGFVAWRLESLVLTYLGELSGQFAKDSAVVFLAGSDSAAQERVAQIAAFPGVQQAGLLKADAEIWVTSRDTRRWPVTSPPSDSKVEGSRATLMHEDRDYWYFIASIRLGAHEAAPTATWSEPQVLGYVAVGWRKAPLAHLRYWLFALNGSIALALAAGIFVALHVFLRRLTEPLDGLASVMQRLRSGETGVRAAVTGPAETREIGEAFNALLEQLEQHQATLEAKVSMRTQELRTALDAALSADHHKSAFVANMTHEMRTPLQSIIGYLQAATRELKFIKEDVDSETFNNLTDYLQVSQKASDELRSRINQVLEHAALEAGKREVTLGPVDLSRLLEQVVLIVKPLSESHRNRLTVIREGPPHVEMDEDKLRQIIRNLLDNACKFTHNGTVLLDVRNAADNLVIEVVDSGIGIPQDQLDLIFEPFRQVDMSDTRRYGGTGLGLAITKNVCQLLGGTITVASTLGRGSRFRVGIPLPVRSIFSGERARWEHLGAAAA